MHRVDLRCFVTLSLNSGVTKDGDGAVTDGVTLFTSKTDYLFQSSPSRVTTKNDDLFLVIVLQITVITPTLSTFPGDRLSSILVTRKKYLNFHYGVTPWMVSSAAVSP